jgi:hypothetical protein
MMKMMKMKPLLPMMMMMTRGTVVVVVSPLRAVAMSGVVAPVHSVPSASFVVASTRSLRQLGLDGGGPKTRPCLRYYRFRHAGETRDCRSPRSSSNHCLLGRDWGPSPPPLPSPHWILQ